MSHGVTTAVLLAYTPLLDCGGEQLLHRACVVTCGAELENQHHSVHHLDHTFKPENTKNHKNLNLLLMSASAAHAGRTQLTLARATQTKLVNSRETVEAGSQSHQLMLKRCKHFELGSQKKDAGAIIASRRSMHSAIVGDFNCFSRVVCKL